MRQNKVRNPNDDKNNMEMLMQSLIIISAIHHVFAQEIDDIKKQDTTSLTKFLLIV